MRKMTRNNISQACIILILESSAYTLYTRKTNDVLYTYSVYPCVRGVSQHETALLYTSGYIPTTLPPILRVCLVDTCR